MVAPTVAAATTGGGLGGKPKILVVAGVSDLLLGSIAATWDVVEVHNPLRALVRLAFVDDEDRVDHPRHPEGEGQEEVQDRLARLSREQHCQRRQDDGDQIEHSGQSLQQ